MKKFLILTTLLCLGAGSAQALTSDRRQPIEIQADSFFGDEVKQMASYSGNVAVNQGSTALRGARLDMSITPKGYRRIELKGSPASFKQQRDPKTPGQAEWINANAERIIYDEESDMVTLKGHAKLTRTVNGVQKDSTSGEVIAYDMSNGRAEIKGGVVNGQPQRVTTIIAPRKSEPAKPAAANPSLSTSVTLTPTEKQGQ